MTRGSSQVTFHGASSQITLLLCLIWDNKAPVTEQEQLQDCATSLQALHHFRSMRAFQQIPWVPELTLTIIISKDISSEQSDC